MKVFPPITLGSSAGACVLSSLTPGRLYKIHVSTFSGPNQRAQFIEGRTGKPNQHNRWVKKMRLHLFSFKILVFDLLAHLGLLHWLNLVNKTGHSKMSQNRTNLTQAKDKLTTVLISVPFPPPFSLFWFFCLLLFFSPPACSSQQGQEHPREQQWAEQQPEDQLDPGAG